MAVTLASNIAPRTYCQGDLRKAQIGSMFKVQFNVGFAATASRNSVGAHVKSDHALNAPHSYGNVE
jgi:hypothetical protein